jgi:hypothetical protein
MKPKQLLVIGASFLCFNLHLHAQTASSFSDQSFLATSGADATEGNPANFIKVNFTALFLKNYSIQYERILNKTVSVAVSFRTMPTTAIPFKDAIQESLGDDEQDTKDAIEMLRLSNIAVTPEVRFYVGRKGYGRGFYIAPFYRYANFKASNIRVDYEYGVAFQNSLGLSGKLSSNTGGLMIGSQWTIGKFLALDWWILGAHYGAGNGNFSGIADHPLSPEEQNAIRQELEDLDIPLADKTVFVNASGATLKLSGPWGGIRGGITFGVRF